MLKNTLVSLLEGNFRQSLSPNKIQNNKIILLLEFAISFKQAIYDVNESYLKTITRSLFKYSIANRRSEQYNALRKENGFKIRTIK